MALLLVLPRHHMLRWIHSLYPAGHCISRRLLPVALRGRDVRAIHNYIKHLNKAMIPILPNTPSSPSFPRRASRMHPKSLGTISLLFLYLALLWRSTRKAEELYVRVMWEKRHFFQLAAKAHGELLKYVSSKVFRLLILLLEVVSGVLEGPAEQAAEFLKNLQQHGVNRFNELLAEQMDPLGEKMKDVVADPYMPKFLRIAMSDAVDSLLPDAYRLIQTKTHQIVHENSVISKMWRDIDRKKKRKPVTRPTQYNGGVLIAYANDARETLWRVGAAPYTWWYSSALAASIGGANAGTGTTAQIAIDDQNKRADEILDEIATSDDEEYECDDDDDDDEYDDNGHPRTNPDPVRRSRRKSLARRFALQWSRLRANILYVSSPCDKSTWQCLRDIRWILLTTIGLAPYGIGTIWWVFLFALHEITDEYQLCNFIVGFMASKFLGGCGLIVLGAFKYYLCATRDVITCAEDGPRVYEFLDGILFFAQTLLVWSCFFLLPRTKPCLQVYDDRDIYLVQDMETVHMRLGPNRPRGGRLVDLFWWDSFCVFFVLVLAISAMSGFGQTGWQLRATLFWLKAVFGLLAAPFLVFKIPVISTLLTQVRPTGYDNRGRVRLHVRARPPVETAPEDSNNTGASDTSIAPVMNFATMTPSAALRTTARFTSSPESKSPIHASRSWSRLLNQNSDGTLGTSHPSSPRLEQLNSVGFDEQLLAPILQEED